MTLLVEEQIKFYYEHNKDKELTAKKYCIDVESFRKSLSRYKKKYPKIILELEENYNSGLQVSIDEIIKENVRYRKEKQKIQDLNRIQNKSFRDQSRIENAVEEYAKQINEQLITYNDFLKDITIEHDVVKNKYTGLIQLSDLHFNELINLEHNEYNFDIAAKRLKKFANEIKILFTAYNISNIILAFTGDILNHDKLLDKLLNQAVNRSKATILSFKLLQLFILDINKNFNVNIISVLGNEGRVKDEMSFSYNVISDNYDFVIVAMLKEIFNNCSGIKFGSIDKLEEVININGINILLTHGYSVKGDIEKTITQMIGRYTARKIFIDYVLLGHFHSSRIGDIYSRSSSLCGSNSYSEDGLNLYGKASQNCFVVNEKSINSFRIDLQHCDNISGYNINEYLKEYNAKSTDKVYNTLFKI